MNTLPEAIQYLNSLGFYACERLISGERVVFAGAEAVSCVSGELIFKKGLYIRRVNNSWTIVVMEPTIAAPFTTPGTLREACDEAAALLGYVFHIPVSR